MNSNEPSNLWDLEHVIDPEADRFECERLESILKTDIREEALAIDVQANPDSYLGNASDQPERNLDIGSDQLSVSELPSDSEMALGESYANSRAEAVTRIVSDLDEPRPPSDSCLFCERSLQQAGGRRIAGQCNCGVSLQSRSRAEELAGSRENGRFVSLFDKAGVAVVLWGSAQQANADNLEKARNIYLAGHRAWICQSCIGRTCVKCSAPIRWPGGADVVSAGRLMHLPAMSGIDACTNRRCENYRASSK